MRKHKPRLREEIKQAAIDLSIWYCFGLFVLFGTLYAIGFIFGMQL